QCVPAHPRRAGRQRQPGVPARGDGPVQVGDEAHAAGAVLARARLLRARPSDAGAGHGGEPVRRAAARIRRGGDRDPRGEGRVRAATAGARREGRRAEAEPVGGPRRPARSRPLTGRGPAPRRLPARASPAWQTGVLPILLPLLPETPTDSGQDTIVDGSLHAQESVRRTLYPPPEEALLAIAAGDHVIAATPTGSGKTTIAYSAIFAAMARGQRSYSTAPIKALVSEKFFDLVA